MQLIIVAILLSIYGLCAYKIIMSLLELVHNHKHQHPYKVYVICFLAIFPILFGVFPILNAVNNGVIFTHTNALFFPIFALLSLISGIALILTMLSSKFSPKGILKKITFTLFWIFFMFWNVGLWAITIYSSRALRARIRMPADELGYRYEPYYSTRYAGPGTGEMMQNLGRSEPEHNPEQPFYYNQTKQTNGME